MKTIILCGGRGTRLKEETEFKPKPMILVGGRPLLWHIMKIYSHHGFNEFILALGYKGGMIKDYFRKNPHDFKVHCVDTGLDSMTGERILRVANLLKGDGEFMVTYGDGVADIDIKELVNFHRRQKTLGTITAVYPRSKYGVLKVDKRRGFVAGFEQRPLIKERVSGGFNVFQEKALRYFTKGYMEEAFPKLIAKNHLSVYQHKGFWKAVDTYRELKEINELWKTTKPWALWSGYV